MEQWKLRLICCFVFLCVARITSYNVCYTKLLRFGEYPGQLRDILGIWVEETDALFPTENNTMIMDAASGFKKKEYSCEFLCDLLHTRGAATLRNNFV